MKDTIINFNEHNKKTDVAAASTNIQGVRLNLPS